MNRYVTGIGITCALLAAQLVLVPSTAAAGRSHMCAGFPATIVGTPGDDMIVGTKGDDVIFGFAGQDRISGLGGMDIICGGRGADTIHGYKAGFAITGRPGDDLLGGRGNDKLYGDQGFTFFAGGSGNDLMDDHNAAPQGAYVDYDSSPGPVVVDLGAGFATGEGNDTLIGISGVVGSDYNDTLISGPFSRPGPFPNGLGPSGELLGFGGNDLLVVAPGTFPEAVEGGDGDDTFVGSQSRHCNFWIHGNRGNDTFSTSSRGSCINGGHGNDTIHGNSGADRVNAGPGNDTIFGRGGRDSFTAGSGSDHLHGNRGFDSLLATDGVSGNDTVAGGRGTDSCQADLGDAVTRCES
jgi:Ca2+-binding RTX toxin-like protein